VQLRVHDVCHVCALLSVAGEGMSTMLNYQDTLPPTDLTAEIRWLQSAAMTGGEREHELKRLSPSSLLPSKEPALCVKRPWCRTTRFNASVRGRSTCYCSDGPWGTSARTHLRELHVSFTLSHYIYRRLIVFSIRSATFIQCKLGCIHACIGGRCHCRTYIRSS
jgi:hypothetical protein